MVSDENSAGTGKMMSLKEGWDDLELGDDSVIYVVLELENREVVGFYLLHGG